MHNRKIPAKPAATLRHDASMWMAESSTPGFLLCASYVHDHGVDAQALRPPEGGRHPCLHSFPATLLKLLRCLAPI